MPETMEIHGICTVCKDGPTCTLRNGRVLLQCDRFEPYKNPPLRTAIEDFMTPSNLRVRTIVEVEESRKFKGLCENCEDRHTCVFPKPVEGVWHCEEYQ